MLKLWSIILISTLLSFALCAPPGKTYAPRAALDSPTLAVREPAIPGKTYAPRAILDSPTLAVREPAIPDKTYAPRAAPDLPTLAVREPALPEKTYSPRGVATPMHTDPPRSPQNTVERRDDSIQRLWPKDLAICLKKPITRYCDSDILKCTNSCLVWDCGFCFLPEVPTEVAWRFPWPPVPPETLIGEARERIISYDKITQGMLIQWLKDNGVKLDRNVVGKDEYFKIAAWQANVISGKAGVQGV